MDRRRLARTVLWLYPRAWRERYGDEVLALVEETEVDLFAAIDLACGALTEQWRALLSGEGTSNARGLRGLLFVLALFFVSVLVAAGLIGSGIPLPNSRLLGFAQYLSALALVRALAGSRVKVLQLRSAEIAVWMTAFVMSGVILQLSWPPHAYWTWMLGDVHGGRYAAFSSIYGAYLVLIGMPAAYRARREHRVKVAVE